MKNTIKIAGVEYLLRFSFEALCLMQERFGLNALHESTFDPAPRTIAILLWGGIQHANPNITLAQVQQGLAIVDMKDAYGLCVTALTEALPQKADDTAGAQ